MRASVPIRQNRRSLRNFIFLNKKWIQFPGGFKKKGRRQGRIIQIGKNHDLNFSIRAPILVREKFGAKHHLLF